MKTKSTPFGAIELPVNPLALAIISGATFVARGYSGEIDHLAGLIAKAIKHKGFAVIDVLQPCVSFNPQYSYNYYNPRIYKLEEAGHDVSDINKALQLALSTDSEKIPIGLFYQTSRETYEEASKELDDKPLFEDDIENIDISPLLEKILSS
jgi:2-oxoglutarate ferredoxin oxidoreductase subunit beta